MLGLGFGLIGAGAMIPLGPSFAKEVLNGGSAAFGVLMTALGFGAAFGVVTLLWLQGRLPRITVFCFAVIGTGGFLVLAASFSPLAPAALMIGGVGACAGTSYVTGFTVLQESVERRVARADVRHALHRRPPVSARSRSPSRRCGRTSGTG